MADCSATANEVAPTASMKDGMTHSRSSRPGPCSRGAAFTLVELLVVISIIVLLAALLLPVLSKAKESSRSAACLSNLHQIGIALQLYAQDNHNQLPLLGNLGATNNPSATNLPLVNMALSNYVGAPQVFRCPSDQQKIFENTGSSFWWNTFLNGQDSDHLSIGPMEFDPHNIPLLFDKEAFHKARGQGKGVNYLYADGHIQNILVLEGTK
jgi:prepilin-type processing-associated H-X9-DG protein/prepilin-type N-terminal cleavage/methylation domain-containing protein